MLKHIIFVQTSIGEQAKLSYMLLHEDLRILNEFLVRKSEILDLNTLLLRELDWSKRDWVLCKGKIIVWFDIKFCNRRILFGVLYFH